MTSEETRYCTNIQERTSCLTPCLFEVKHATTNYKFTILVEELELQTSVSRPNLLSSPFKLQQGSNSNIRACKFLHTKYILGY